MVRAKPACRSRLLMSSSLTLCPSRSDAQFSRSLFGMQNGAPRQRAGAELCGRDEGELARAQRSCPLRTLAARLAALRAPLPENSSDFGLLCAQTGLSTHLPSQQLFRLSAVQGKLAASTSATGRLSKLQWPPCSRATACDSVRSERRSLHRVRYACSRWRAIYLWPSASTV